MCVIPATTMPQNVCMGQRTGRWLRLARINGTPEQKTWIINVSAALLRSALSVCSLQDGVCECMHFSFPVFVGLVRKAFPGFNCEPSLCVATKPASEWLAASPTWPSASPTWPSAWLPGCLAVAVLYTCRCMWVGGFKDLLRSHQPNRFM